MLIRVSRSLVVSLYSIFIEALPGSARLYRRGFGDGVRRRRRKNEGGAVDDAAHRHLQILRAPERRRVEGPPFDHARMTAALAQERREIERRPMELEIQESPRPLGAIGRRHGRGRQRGLERSGIILAWTGPQGRID